MIRTQIQLTEEQAEALRDLARRRNESMAELVRAAIDYWLQTASPVSVEERRKRALAIVGRYQSDRSDVSTRHDDYLAEAFAQW